MKTDRKLISIAANVIPFLVLTLGFLAACSALPVVSRSVDALNISNAAPPPDATMPRAVLTIAPTQAPPTATAQNTLAPTQTRVISTPTDIPAATATQPLPTPTAQEPATATQSGPINTPTEMPQSDQTSCLQGCTEPIPGCDIKGNINNEGVKIYHVPGQDFYDKTIIDPQKGERWFCSPIEAEANGWRASKR